MSRPLIVAHTGTGGERGRIMSPDGISVALSATDYKDPPKVLVEEKVNGRQNNRSRLTEPGKRSPGQGPSFIGGGTVPCIITETEAKTWLKESLLQAEGETQAIHQTEPQAHQRNNG